MIRMPPNKRFKLTNALGKPLRLLGSHHPGRGRAQLLAPATMSFAA